MKPLHASAAISMASLALALTAGAPVRAATVTDEALQEAWRVSMAHTPAPRAGCFRTDYPNPTWIEVGCVSAPVRSQPRRGHALPLTVGNGADYSVVAAGTISRTVGSFPTVTGVSGETDEGVRNFYSLQINSQFFASPTCAGAAKPSQCLGWEQFVYDSQGAAYMQYWLIAYGSACPAGWFSDGGGDCYENSNAVNVPKEAIGGLKKLKMSGIAVANGIDTLIFTAGTKAYSTTGKDSVLDVAGYWKASEFNIFGDGNGSEAVFNKGAAIKVQIALTDGTSVAPTCTGNDGTTGETNNLNLGPCAVTGGATPTATFTESLPK